MQYRVYTKRDIITKNGIFYDKETGYPIEGIKRTYYKNGTILDEGKVSDGMYNGKQNVYDPTGSLWFVNVWKDNVLVEYKRV